MHNQGKGMQCADLCLPSDRCLSKEQLSSVKWSRWWQSTYWAVTPWQLGRRIWFLASYSAILVIDFELCKYSNLKAEGRRPDLRGFPTHAVYISWTQAVLCQVRHPFFLQETCLGMIFPLALLILRYFPGSIPAVCAMQIKNCILDLVLVAKVCLVIGTCSIFPSVFVHCTKTPHLYTLW